MIKSLDGTYLSTKYFYVDRYGFIRFKSNDTYTGVRGFYIIKSNYKTINERILNVRRHS